MVDKSLVRKTASGRYELHELIRQFAFETLARDEKELADTQQRFADFFAGLVLERAASLAAGGRSGAIQEVELELENVQAAWFLAVARGDRRTLQSLSDGVFWLCEWRNRYREGLELFRQAVRQIGEDFQAGEGWLAGLMVRGGRFHALLLKASFVQKISVSPFQQGETEISFLSIIRPSRDRQRSGFHPVLNVNFHRFTDESGEVRVDLIEVGLETRVVVVTIRQS